ncbi:hypothetical protein PAMP_006419 [Pampus punctatissimus]
MQRSKATVSVEVKQVIGALCRLLAATGLDAVPAPETFRRAKFGGEVEVENQFWQLLINIFQTTRTISSEASTQLKEASEHKKLVAAGLWQTGYYADWIYVRKGRERGEEVRFSSRDLLLALGWLLATGTLEKLLTLRIRYLDKTLLTPTPMNPQISHGVQLDSTSLRRLQWLIGSLRHQGQTLLSMHEERARLLHAVFSASFPPSLSSSSSDQSAAVLREDCACTRDICDLLEAYLSWKRVENVFWTWMDSVMDCHLQDVVERPTHTANRRAAVCFHGNQGLEKLEDMLLRLPTSQKGQKGGRRDAEDRGKRGERLQDGLDAFSLPPLLSSLTSLPSLAPLSQAYRARLDVERPVRHSSRPAEMLRSRADDPYELSASQATQLLLHIEARLLERRDRQRLANRMQLQEMTGRLDELVLIPP